MKTKNKDSKHTESIKAISVPGFSHYFHADEDFREDRHWGKIKDSAEGHQSKKQGK